MNKTIIITVALLAITLNAFAQNLTPSKALSFIKQPYSKVKSSLIQEGYSFVEKDDEFFVFQKNGYKLTVGLEQDAVSIISAEENANDYAKFVSYLKFSKFVFSEKNQFPAPPQQLRPMLIMRFDKAPKYTCMIVTPYNYEQSKMLSINYSTYQTN